MDTAGIEQKITAVQALRWHNAAEVAAADHAEVARLIDAAFSDLDLAKAPLHRQVALVLHVLALYSQSWHAEGRRFVGPIEGVLQRCLEAEATPLNDLCTIYDALLFLYWYSDVSIEAQAGFATGCAEPFAIWLRARFQTDALAAAPARPFKAPLHLTYLAQFGRLGAGDPISAAALALLGGLARHFPGRYRITLIAWMFHDDPSTQAFEAAGIKVLRIGDGNTAERIEAVRAAILTDPADILLSDMNTALPTVIFEQRLAPIQMFYQLGLPFWPLRHLDGVFRVWNTAPQRMGFTPAQCFQLNGPWDLEALAPAVDAEAVRELRSQIAPAGGLVIGCYGRLIKITPEYLALVRSLVEQHPGMTVAIGGSGDAEPIQRFIAQHQLEKRVRLFPGYVDGHVWGHVLDVFLDTFPLHGGASCREMVAKGKPVVSLHDADMPNLAEEERVPPLVAQNLTEYEQIVSRLIRDSGFRATMQAETLRLARTRPRQSDYAAKADKAFRTLIRRRHPGRILGWLQGFNPLRRRA
jgi:hypothetical protein